MEPLVHVVVHFADAIAKPSLDDVSEHHQAAKLRRAVDGCAPARS